MILGYKFHIPIGSYSNGKCNHTARLTTSNTKVMLNPNYHGWYLTFEFHQQILEFVDDYSLQFVYKPNMRDGYWFVSIEDKTKAMLIKLTYGISIDNDLDLSNMIKILDS